MSSNSDIKGYHAHVYFDEASAEQARALRERVSEEFDYAVGRFHEKNVGPRPRWSFQIAFKTDEFGTIVPWLALNRKGLTAKICRRSYTYRYFCQHFNYFYSNVSGPTCRMELAATNFCCQFPDGSEAEH